MQIELSVDAPAWEGLAIEKVARRACGAVVDHLGLARDLVEISLLATDDTAIAALNTAFRERAGPTNVLSWPAEDLGSGVPGAAPDLPVPGVDGMIALGDIAIAYGTCAVEAATGEIPLEDHVTHLIVHGTLHLLGYDHTHDADAGRMERLEIEILGKMGIDDPYRDRTAADPQ